MGAINKIVLAAGILAMSYAGARTGACNYAAEKILPNEKAELVKKASDQYVRTFDGLERRIKNVYQH